MTLAINPKVLERKVKAKTLMINYNSNLPFIPDPKTDIEELSRKGAEEKIAQFIKSEVDKILDYRKALPPEERKDYNINGYQTREIALKAGAVSLTYPIFRGVSYIPSCLDKYARKSPELEHFVETLYVLGLSTRNIAEAIKKGLNIDISKSTVSRINVKFDETVKAVQESDLRDKKYAIIFADATYMPVRIESTDGEHVQSLANTIILGVNEETGMLELLYSAIHKQEDSNIYRCIFEKLKQRGLKETPMLAVSDAQRGLQKAFYKVFPETINSTCLFHSLKNCFDKLYDEDDAEFRQFCKDIVAAPENERAGMFEEAYTCYKDMRRRINSLKKGLQDFCPQEIFSSINQAKISTSNAIESKNRIIKSRRKVQNAFPNREAAQRISIKRLDAHLKKQPPFIDPQELKQARQKWLELQDQIQTRLYEFVKAEHLLDASSLEGRYAPVLTLDLEDVPFEFEGRIHSLKFLKASLQTQLAEQKEVIGIYPVFGYIQDEIERLLEILLDRGLETDCLKAIECSAEERLLYQAIKNVFGSVPIQIDPQTYKNTLISEMPKKYREGFSACIDAISSENELEAAQTILENVSKSLEYHNQLLIKERFDNSAQELLTFKKLGIKHSDQVRFVSQSRIAFSRDKKAVKPLEEVVSSYFETVFKRSYTKKVWFNQEDIDFLFSLLE